MNGGPSMMVILTLDESPIMFWYIYRKICMLYSMWSKCFVLFILLWNKILWLGIGVHLRAHATTYWVWATPVLAKLLPHLPGANELINQIPLFVIFFIMCFRNTVYLLYIMLFFFGFFFFYPRLVSVFLHNFISNPGMVYGSLKNANSWYAVEFILIYYEA